MGVVLRVHHSQLQCAERRSVPVAGARHLASALPNALMLGVVRWTSWVLPALAPQPSSSIDV